MSKATNNKIFYRKKNNLILQLKKTEFFRKEANESIKRFMNVIEMIKFKEEIYVI